MGDHKEAKAQFEKALAGYGAGNAYLLKEFSKFLYFDMKNFKYANEITKQGIKVAPKNVNLWFRYGMSFNFMRDCKATGALKTYAQICSEKKGGCNKKNSSIAASTREALISHGYCKDTEATKLSDLDVG